MRALFVGGTVDNSELDLTGAQPPAHYPENSGSGQSRYRLHHTGTRGNEVVYAVYAAPDSDDGAVQRIAEERQYARRFGVEPQRKD